MPRPPPRSTLFPYTTLFRSGVRLCPFAGLERPLDLTALFRTSAPLRLSREVQRTLQRSEEHTSELQSQFHLVCRLLLEKKKKWLLILDGLVSPPSRYASRVV